MGVIPEFSFILGGPEDPEEEIDRTFRFIKRLKSLHPECEVILYFYTPTPRPTGSRQRDDDHGLELPATPEEWAEPRWVDFVCHRDAPWLTPALRRRVEDFAVVLGCRFPTVQDTTTPAWGKTLLRSLAGWRWASGIYNRPRELRWVADRLDLREPQTESL